MTRSTETQDDAYRPTSRGPEVHDAPHLFVVLECDRPAASGARFTLDGVGQVILGRGPERKAWRELCDGLVTLHVQVPGRSMSRQHARLVCSRGQWVLHDLQSRNGTFVGETRIEQHALPEGGLFEAGHSLFFLAPRLPTPAGTTDLDAATSGELPPTLTSLLPALQAQARAFALAARASVPLLIRGETGTGKELFARAAHALSGRAGRFVAVSCGALTAEGRGGLEEPAFFRAAEGGTLFLDEVGDLSLAAQATLLRLVEDPRVRVVAATHQPLEADVTQQRFRADLLARLAGYSHTLAPLRERKVDLGLILAPTLSAAPATSTLEVEVGRALWGHSWPLNAREVRQCLASALVLAAGAEVRLAHLPAHLAADEPPEPSVDDELRTSLQQALRSARGNVAEVARVFGKGPTQIHRWMKRFGLNPASFR